jgi:hypothetical protein
MRAVILADESFATRERAMLSRLEVGLADEGVRVVHAIPLRAAKWYQPEVFTQAVTYMDQGFSFSLRWRTQQLARALEALAEGDERAVDIVHAFGHPAWPIAIELVRQTGSGLAVEVWCRDLIRSAGRLRLPGGAAGGRGPGAGAANLPPVFFAPDPGIEHALRDEDTSLSVRLTPWGVHTPAAPREILRPGRAISIMVDASGMGGEAMAAALEGLAGVAAAVPEVMIFAESEAVRVAGLWPMIRRLGLTDRFTLIPDLEARREMSLRGDVLILPEARGEFRSLALDAMAHGMLVIAAADPLVTVLIDGRTARLVDRPAAERWRGAISWALSDRPAAIALARSAQDYIRQSRRASGHISAVVDAYEWMTSRESIPFEAGAKVR